MRRPLNGKVSCLGKGCQTVYEAHEVIDPENENDGLWAGGSSARCLEVTVQTVPLGSSAVA
jgi:hypothetical protein